MIVPRTTPHSLRLTAFETIMFARVSVDTTWEIGFIDCNRDLMHTTPPRTASYLIYVPSTCVITTVKSTTKAHVHSARGKTEI